MRKLEIFWAIACGALIAGVSLGVDSRRIPEDGPAVAITNSTATSVSTNPAIVSGWVDAIGVDFTMVTNAYALTNGATASDPDIQGGYFYNGAFGTSTQSFLEDGGVYDLWFTNGVWYINATRGTTTHGWTSINNTVTGKYASNGTKSTGVVQVVALYADMDIDILTVSNRGVGAYQTLYSADDINATDITKYVRVDNHSTGGVANVGTNQSRIVLVNDLVILQLYDSFSTGITAKANVILSPVP